MIPSIAYRLHSLSMLIRRFDFVNLDFRIRLIFCFSTLFVELLKLLLIDLEAVSIELEKPNHFAKLLFEFERLLAELDNAERKQMKISNKFFFSSKKIGIPKKYFT